MLGKAVLKQVPPLHSPSPHPTEKLSPSLPGWLDNELKISNSFLDDDDVDDLGEWLGGILTCPLRTIYYMSYIKDYIVAAHLTLPRVRPVPRDPEGPGGPAGERGRGGAAGATSQGEQTRDPTSPQPPPPRRPPRRARVTAPPARGRASRPQASTPPSHTTRPSIWAPTCRCCRGGSL